jgi:hypothetical protein
VSLLSGIISAIAGAAEIAAGVLIAVGTLGGGTPLAVMLIASGAGMVLGGIGTMLAGQVKGFATTTRNPIAPWKVCYGRCRTGGTLVYMHMWGDSNQMLDLVIVLAAHPCDSVVELLFDQQRIQIDTTAVPPGTVAANSGTSFTPVQQTVSITSIVRNDGLVTVTLPNDIPYLVEGETVIVKNVGTDHTLNGTFSVYQIISRGSPGIVFTYLNGGANISLTSGEVKTTWADYARDVYVEYLLGNQTLGQTFVGMTAGTPWQGTGTLCGPDFTHDAGGDSAPNPWTNFCSLEGKTAAFVRLKYSSHFKAGLPQISFHVQGKNDIFDPRGSGGLGSTGYSENAALCIADYLHNSLLGFKAAYGTEIPLADLTTAANICDQAVALKAGGTEPRYACNGQFDVTSKRGEVLQNMLTACAGRLTYYSGQYRIHPAAWNGPGTVANLQAIAAGPMRWRPTVPIRDLYNAVKGTFISPASKWQSTDFPYYAQDSIHGYSNGTPPNDYDANLDADGGDRRWLDIQLPFTISPSAAQRIAKIELLRRRHQGTGTFALNMAGYQFVPMDILQATVGYLGFSGRLLEVQAFRFRVDAKESAPLLGTEIDVQETDSSIYGWSTSEETTLGGYTGTNYPGPTTFTTSGTRVITVPSGGATYTQLSTDYIVVFDTSVGAAIYNLLPFAEFPNDVIIVEKKSATANSNTVTINTAVGDKFPNGKTQIIITTEGGFSQIAFPGTLPSGAIDSGPTIVSGVGSPGAGAGAYIVTITTVGGVKHATPDLSQGDHQYVTLVNGTTTTIDAPTNDGGPGTQFWLVLMQDSTGGGKVTLPWIAPVPGTPGTPGYVDMTDREINTAPNAITRILFSKQHDDISWLYFAQTDSL